MADIFRVDLYPHNWLTGTMGLTPVQRGVYIQIVCMIYANRGPIRNDPAWIGRASNCSPRLARSVIADLVVLEKLTVSQDGFITNSRAENVLKDVRVRSEHAANMRRVQLEKKEEAKKNNKVGAADKQQQVSVSVSEEDIIKDTGWVSATEIGMHFENIWNAYPGRGKNGATGAAFKGEKKTARLRFETIYKNTKEADREALVRNIIEAAGRYAEFIARADYPSKHLSTWLSAAGWQTDYGTTGIIAAAAGGRPASKHERARAIMLDDDSSVVASGSGGQGSPE